MTNTKRAVNAQGAKAATTQAKTVSKTAQKDLSNPITIVQDNLPDEVKKGLLFDLAEHLTGGENIYRFILTGKNTFIEFSIKPSKAITPERQVQFLTANIYERVKKVFSLPYARNFSKGNTMQLYFTANGKILDTAKISSQLGITLKPGKNQFESRPDALPPFKGKIQDLVEASIVMMDTKDYSLPA